ncbi:MAG: type II secretion system F family protein [Terrimicrobiaceae bacterium]
MQPGFRTKARFFHELAQLLRSGIGLPQAMELLVRGRGASHLAASIQRGLTRGDSVPGAFAGAGFSAGDCAVIEAGTASGHLDTIFGSLASHYERLAKARSAVIAKSLYPIFVLHLAVVLLAIPLAVIDGTKVGYVVNVLGTLGFFYAVAALGAVLWLGLCRAFASQASLARMILLIPMVGAWLETWTGSRFASVFSLFVTSGGSLLRGLELAGASSGSALIHEASLSTLAGVREGRSLSDAFTGHAGVPQEIERAIQVGDHSGRLDEETRRAAEALQTKAIAWLDALAEWMPRILYVGVAFYVGWRIISTAMQVGGAVGEALDLSMR